MLYIHISYICKPNSLSPGAPPVLSSLWSLSPRLQHAPNPHRFHIGSTWIYFHIFHKPQGAPRCRPNTPPCSRSLRRSSHRLHPFASICVMAWAVKVCESEVSWSAECIQKFDAVAAHPLASVHFETPIQIIECRDQSKSPAPRSDEAPCSSYRTCYTSECTLEGWRLQEIIQHPTWMPSTTDIQRPDINRPIQPKIHRHNAKTCGSSKATRLGD